MIKPAELIDKFQYALDDGWGYIYGTSHEMWSAEKQKQYARDYAGDPDRENSCKYGGKWAGHWVTDCSGLFKWAYSQLGHSIAHGSNSIWDSYCSGKGELRKGVRKDGQELKPGTAVFTTTGDRHNHIGLYAGGGTVIEAQGAQAGVTTSNITASKWTAWGELKDVEYAGGGGETKRGIVTAPSGSSVNLRKEPSRSAALIERIPIGSVCEIHEERGEWDRITTCGRTGWMMSQYIRPDGGEPGKTYTVTIPGLQYDKAKEITDQYPGSMMEEDAG